MRDLDYGVRGQLGVGWRENKWLLCFCSLFAVGGIVLGMVVVFDPLLDHFRITRELLDGNIINAASPNRGVFSFILVRLIDFLFSFGLVMLFCLSKWTFLLVFPFLAFRSFWMVVNLFWILDRFGMAHGLVLFLVYSVVLTFVLMVFICSIIFALKRGKQCRVYGLRVGLRWGEVRAHACCFLIILTAVGFVEWLLYFLVLSRMVFII